MAIDDPQTCERPKCNELVEHRGEERLERDNSLASGQGMVTHFVAYCAADHKQRGNLHAH